MAMPLVAPRYTIADLDRFPDDGNRYELLGGVLLVTPQAGVPHQAVLGRLIQALWAYLGSTGPGFIMAPGAIQAGNDTHLEPDLLIISARFANVKSWRQIRDWWLAVEVSGPASRIYDRDFKTAAYLRAGVREVWRLDLRDRTLYLSRTGQPVEIPHRAQVVWHPVEMAEPLTLDIAAIFGPRSEDSD